MDILKAHQRGVIEQAVSEFGSWLEREVFGYFDRLNLGGEGKQPVEWATIRKSQAALKKALNDQKLVMPGGDMPLAKDHLPLVKRAVIVRRRMEAERIRQLQDKTLHLEVLNAYDVELSVLDDLLREPWLEDVAPCPVPRLTELLPIQRIMEAERLDFRLLPRKFDEKFHILQSPELFLPDLQAYRSQTDVRGSCTSVVFLDIDDFKVFNDKYGETAVDRSILPRFMQWIEAHVCFHGQAYRQGGDEYLLILPGLSQKFVLVFVEELRAVIAQLTYPKVKERLTVSIGVCSADPDCHLINREMQERANRAKEHAKKNGKNRIAHYEGNEFTERELRFYPSETA
jgi:diguanylate cyclase (GGDEF)-like protein